MECYGVKPIPLQAGWETVLQIKAVDGTIVGADPAQLTPAQALFLSTLLPSPTRWRGRVGKDGELRPWTRAQMHFIGRAMIAKGWLDPADLPPADSLEVRVNGPARRMLSPESPPLAVPADSARAEGRSSS